MTFKYATVRFKYADMAATIGHLPRYVDLQYIFDIGFREHLDAIREKRQSIVRTFFEVIDRKNENIIYGCDYSAPLCPAKL